MSGAVFPLQDSQLAAANPRDNVWLSASAGTGKTQVLSARVLRLLLTPGVDPAQILCLTFTKAGAAEMANRINDVLARWVRLEETQLAEELSHLGADVSPSTLAHARTLFASVIDCPGGGLRIDTIHAFSQWLLANFPEEADLTPGARPMEDRERELLAREVLTELLSEKGEASTFANSVAEFSLNKGPDALHQWLMRCAGAADLWEGQSAWKAPMRERVLRLLGMPINADEAWAVEGLHPDVFPDEHLRAMVPMLNEWGTKTADKCTHFIGEWLSIEHSDRIEAVSRFRGTLLRADGEPALNLRKPREAYPAFVEGQELVAQAVAMVAERQALLNVAQFLTLALEMGSTFAARWEAAKAREGLLDFDDLIRKAARLLGNTDAAAWIRYKLDRSFDHILIDEAQDTNEAQWDIVFALIDDFFSGDGARGDKVRTIFTVGDYKQAIFGFQGTSPENFERARQKVKAAIDGARTNAVEGHENRRLPTWNNLDLGRSYRTALPVLDFVNRTIDAIGHEQFGLTETPAPHVGDDRAGLVTLWAPIMATTETEEDEESERGWLPAHETQMAERIADQVHRWVRDIEPFVLEKGGDRRHAREGDIMVLVRKRTILAREIVAKLHAKGVAVAGVDRLRLGAPLAVRDLMAALRFAAQPLDDLNLANLLSSPVIGWTQDDLLEHVPREKGISLWDHLRKNDANLAVATVTKLRDLLARADYETPQALLSWLLNGPWHARAELIARLGSEANDPIDELINAAFAYQSAQTSSLAGFIEWFDAGEGELKRAPDEANGQVRVMTVHGSKGLQAPIVILADATGAPGRVNEVDLRDDPVGADRHKARLVPMPPLDGEQRAGRIKEAQEAAKAAADEEHWRLLYVAMTRAEEALFVGGSVGPKQAKKGEVDADSWYARLEPIFDSPLLEDPIWGERREWGTRADPVTTSEIADEAPVTCELPAWLHAPIGPEPVPPRPLTPSNAGDDKGVDPPQFPDAAALAARRGTLIHRLLERLPDLPPSERETAAKNWLERQAGDLEAGIQDEMIQSALGVLGQPGFTDLFSDQSLAEVPLTAIVDGIVVAGTADRLLVTSDEVTVVDFKTTRRPPATLEDVPKSTLRQMAAYAGALEVIYPGRKIRAAILYTQTPQLIEVPPVTLAVHKDRLGDKQESYAPQRIE